MKSTKITPLPVYFDIKVRVTRDDIKRGRSGDCERCPVALALLRALDKKFPRHRGEFSVDVTGYLLEVFWDRKIHRGSIFCFQCSDTSETIDKFISDFDEDDKVKPFSFEATFSVETA